MRRGGGTLTLHADDLLWFDEVFHLVGWVRVYRPVTGHDRMSSRQANSAPLGLVLQFAQIADFKSSFYYPL